MPLIRLVTPALLSALPSPFLPPLLRLSNGTYVNEDRIPSHMQRPLRSGDLIMLAAEEVEGEHRQVRTPSHVSHG